MNVSRAASLLLALCTAAACARQSDPANPPAPTVPLIAHPDPAALIGKAPPPLKVGKWVKGDPIQTFQKGKVYVVDFWATWCGPCKAAIPHLSRLAEQHKDTVEIIGISISERQKDPSDTSYIEKVEEFVRKMGDRMNYRVAVDTPEKSMHATWFKPAGTAGIPTAYIIDKNGLVAWTGIGSPLDIERIVDQVLAGTFDNQKEIAFQKDREEQAARKAEAELAAARAAPQDDAFAPYHKAMKEGDTAAALASLNAVFKADPVKETGPAYQWKLMLLLQRNKPDEVNEYARDLLQRHAANDDIMSFLSACIVSTSDEPRFDTGLALQSALKAHELAKPDSRWQQFTKWRLGWAYFNTGNREKATELMNSALENIRRLKSTIEFDDLESECLDALKTFKQPAH